MTKFNVGDKVRFTSRIEGYSSSITIGETYIVAEIEEPGFKVNDDEGGSAYIASYEFEKVELVSPKQTKNQRITALENELVETKNEVAELKLIVHELRDRPQLTTVVNNIQEPSAIDDVEDIIEFEGAKYRKVDREAREGDVIRMNGKTSSEAVKSGELFKVSKAVRAETTYGPCPVYVDYYNRTTETIDVYELIKDKPLSPNQQRAQIIEDAKKFVEKHLTSSGHGYGVVGNNTTPLTIGLGPVKYRFEVNADKRAIVAIGALYHTGHVSSNYRGIAKCNPSDVFNEHIGKAIALGRALNIDVSRFEQAMQPNEVVMGMHLEIRTNGGVDFTHKPVGAEDLLECNKAFQKDVSGVFIINDTNAQYFGGVE